MVRRCAFAIACVGCGPVVGVGDGETSGASTTTSNGTTVGMTTILSTSVAEAEVSTAVDTSSSGSVTTVGFIRNPDGGGDIECDVWAQDCPVGEKCMPWANDGGHSWNATRCTPLAEDPKQRGEACTAFGSGVSGIDDCDIAAMCWSVDPETLMGYCVPFCSGSEANPVCEHPCDDCVITGAGIPTPCLPRCDPIAQSCDDDDACYPVNDSFACAPDASGELGALGDPCEYINVCAPGLFCANRESVPDCVGSSGCCAPFCDAAAADVCDMILPGTSCVPWYEDGMQPGGCTTSIVGACVLPT
ncbi:MAG TPA: ribulose phosphate epimerase [Nannocystaceae bacterium]|nr:ribulose phosphate epimerase [Nannocystaceae bacterium]